MPGDGVAVLSTGVAACSGEHLSNLGEMNHAGAGTSSTSAQAGSGGGSGETGPIDEPELHGSAGLGSSLNGSVAFDIATGFDNEKSACEDQDLWNLCKQLLP